MNLPLTRLNELLNCETVQQEAEAAEINGAYCSDLLSDVMANAKEGQALITIQSHKNTVAVAALYGAPCIIICNSRPVPQEMIKAAEEEGIAIFLSTEDQFTVSGKLYRQFFPA
ncbi:DRTGG domain-containing protein [Salinispira pacifica]|uniref:DRTGG domain-containing protein n=1 Tax=Salinispira pacifica TaxID=1307761 RepID=V5WDR7_9SPIO|nr:DRTGG domain-containing protein [Salinispira pacifica]AHC13709.1 DRTGG domain-containing protein [Salinispira pacifica]